MKPKDLKPPFTWEQRRVLIQNEVWYIPEHYTDYNSFKFPGFSDPRLFGNNHPVSIEFCSGNGDWIADLAEKQPHKNFLAVDIRFDRMRKIWSKKQNRKLSNMFCVLADGRVLAKEYLPENSIETVYINFPDPWPKKRHKKHRIIQPCFVAEIARVLKKGGMLVVVTDDSDYREWTKEIVLQSPSFFSALPSPYFVTDPSDYGNSYFDSLWRKMGRTIYYLSFCTK